MDENLIEFDDEDEGRHGENWRIFLEESFFQKEFHIDTIDTLKISKDFIWDSVRDFTMSLDFTMGDESRVKHPFFGPEKEPQTG